MSRDQPRAPFIGNGSHPIVSAHRGFSGEFPENTKTSIAAAIPLADFVEIDVRATADHHLIIMHDRTLRRTTNVADVFPDRADDPVDTFSLEEVRRLDAGSWYGENHVGTRVPTLREALDLLTGTACGALLELKVDIEHLVRDEVTAFLDEVPDFRVAIASVDPDRSRRMFDLTPQLPIGVLFLDQHTITDDEIAGYAEFAGLLAFRTDNVTADLVDRVHSAGARLLHNTNTRSWMDESAEAGADGTMTDYPDRKRESIEKSGVTVIEAEDHAGPGQLRIGNDGLHFKLSGGAALRPAADSEQCLEIPFHVDDSASLTIDCVLVHGPNGGTLDLAVDGCVLIAGHDTYSRSPSRHTTIIGPLDLSNGAHLLKVVATECPTRSTSADMIMDALILRRP